MGPPRAARGRRHGRLQHGRHRGGTYGRARRPRRPRRLRAGRGGCCRAPPRRTPPPTCRPVRGVARGPGRLHGPGLGADGRRGPGVLRVRAGRRGRFRGSRRARAAALGATAAVGDGVRDRRARVPGDRTGRGRHGVAAPARPDRGRRAAVAGGGRHGRRVRVLVHGHAADRRGTRHAVLRSHPGRRRLHRPARRNGLLRRRPGRRQRRRRCRSRPRGPRVEQVSGCRRG